MELLERWSWYGMFMVLALYLTGSIDTGALGFTQSQKGMLMGSVVALLYVLPVFTGALADRFGYRSTLIIAYLILATGYYLMGQVNTYLAMYLVFVWVAIGAALFKPVIAATVSKTTDDLTSSIGFGIFYLMVNLGAFIGPVFASRFRLLSWEWVFNMSALVILVNLLLVLFFFRMPVLKVEKRPLLQELRTVLLNIYEALRDFRFLVFLLLIIGFWTMYNQLFYTLPVFIDQWVDTSSVYRMIAGVSPALARSLGTPEGTIPPELMTNIDAMYIVLLQILVSWWVMRFKPLNAMIGGIFISSIGIGLSFMFNDGIFLFATILVFALGEMASSPKITEYVGKIAPEGKTALYIGASFLPVAGGNFFAGLLSGGTYTRMADKIHLLQLEVSKRGLDIQAPSESFSSNAYLQAAADAMGMDQAGLTQFLWESYQPYQIWMVFTGIGVSTAVLLWLYDRLWLSRA
jgi:dipeptide/tripeptide permease